jgi:hypothetical protein
MQTEQSSNLAKVDLLYCPHALRKCGLFETEQTMKSSGWVIVVFEGEHRQFDGEVAYVKGPFDQYQDATDWAEHSDDCPEGEWQTTFIEMPEAEKVAA